MTYQVIYADPPWAYRNKKTGGSMKSGAQAHYPTMTVDEICQLPVPDICSKDAVLFLWGTVPMLPEALQVMKALTTLWWADDLIEADTWEQAEQICPAGLEIYGEYISEVEGEIDWGKGVEITEQPN